MPEKTGKNLDEWIEILQQQNFEKHAQAIKFLKEQHQVSHGYANTIVALSKQNQAEPDDLIALQYKGKESLKPIYEKLITIVNSMGSDITISAKKGSVSIIRKHQFALIKPSTKTRIDLGLKLKGVEPQGKLEPSGPFGAMCSHRIQLTDISNIDTEVINWLQKAYQMSS